MSERIRPELVGDSDPSSAGDTVPIRWRRRRRRRWYALQTFIRTWTLPVGIAAVSFFVLAVVVMVVLIFNAIGDVEDAQARMDQRFDSVSQSPVTDLSLQDYSDLAATARELNAALTRLDARIGPFQVFASLAGEDTEIQLDVIQARIHLTTGTTYFLNGLSPIIGLLQRESEAASANTTETTPIAKGRRMIELIDAAQIQFVRAENELQAALDIFDKLDQASLSAEALLAVTDYRTFAEQIQAYNQLALESPDLLTGVLGVDEPHTYLILIQNNDELLPSGGYISAWGWMRIRSGRIQDQAYFPTTSSSPRPPAASVAPPFKIPAWWDAYSDSIRPAWDGSLSADFSTTAELARWYYNNGSNPSRPVDGVIGIDLVALEYVMQALGEVYVPDYAVIVNAERLREEVYAVRDEEDAMLDHRRFLAALYASILDEWQQTDLKTQSAVNRALLRALRETHIKLYFADEEVQTAIEALAWAGRQSETQDHDYLMVAEANMGADKSSGSLYRQTTYEVKIETGGTIQNALSVFYDFPASLALQDPALTPTHYGRDRDYEALIQVFTPAGSTFVSGAMSSDITVLEQPAHTVMVGTVDVGYDDSTLMQLDYRSAYETQAFGPYQSYRLLVQKQPGTRTEMTGITVQLPPGTHVVSVSPAPNAQYNLDRPVLEFNVLLRQDEWIEVIFE